jgi:hypothetical protein
VSEEVKEVKSKEVIRYIEEINEFYTNSAHLVMSENDLMIEFGLKVNKNNEMVTTISNRAIMSPSQAKSLSKSLALVIEYHDKKTKEKK